MAKPRAAEPFLASLCLPPLGPPRPWPRPPLWPAVIVFVPLCPPRPAPRRRGCHCQRGAYEGPRSIAGQLRPAESGRGGAGGVASLCQRDSKAITTRSDDAPPRRPGPRQEALRWHCCGLRGWVVTEEASERAPRPRAESRFVAILNRGGRGCQTHPHRSRACFRGATARLSTRRGQDLAGALWLVSEGWHGAGPWAGPVVGWVAALRDIGRGGSGSGSGSARSSAVAWGLRGGNARVKISVALAGGVHKQV